jgi:hypothetical protein
MMNSTLIQLATILVLAMTACPTRTPKSDHRDWASDLYGRFVSPVGALRTA